jgi:peptidoglycan/LPS O-acetylase OafA/YrhL
MTDVAAAPAPQSRLGKFLSLELLDNRYPQLHGLRVFAILSVVQFHVTWIFGGEKRMPLDGGLMASSLTVFFGMDLFFFLSGFLIGSILLHSIATSGTQQLQRFYLRRVFRTFPSYYVVLTFLAVTTALTALQRQHLIYEYVYATNFIRLRPGDVIMYWGWSLALEEQFYLTVPILFFVLQRVRSDKWRIGILLVLFFSALVVRMYVYYHGRPWTDAALRMALYFRTHTRFDTLVGGIILALVHQRYKAAISAWLKAPFHRALVALPSLACLWLLVQPWMFGDGTMQMVLIWSWGTVTSAMYFGCVLLLLHGDGFFVRILSWPIYRRIATLGYGIYLVHIPLCEEVMVPVAQRLSKTLPMSLVWVISLAELMILSVGLSYVMHVLIEKPSLRLRERLAA